MDSFNLSNLTASMTNQLNAGFSSVKKQNLHLQTGKRLIEPADDTGALSVNAKLGTEVSRNAALEQNLQNALSFAQVQDGALRIVGEIVSKSSLLKAQFESSTANQSDKANYDEEFRELQIQLKNMREQKFNGISLFATADTETMLEKSMNPNNLFANANGYDQNLVISRAGLLGSLTLDRTIPSDSGTINATGGPGEFRLPIALAAKSGDLTWWQWPYGATDYFRAYHGTESIHEATYGGNQVFLNDGRVLSPVPGSAHGGASGFPNSDWIKDPNRYDQNKDVIPFGKNGNSSKTLYLVVNESGQTSSGTGWHMEYKIDYEPEKVSLIDNNNVWSLGDFNISDFSTFEENLVGARAENAASQQRILGEINELQQAQLSNESHLERSEGLDIAQAMGNLNLSRNKLSLNANLLKSAQQLENKLYTDFL